MSDSGETVEEKNSTCDRGGFDRRAEGWEGLKGGLPLVTVCFLSPVGEACRQSVQPEQQARRARGKSMSQRELEKV